MVHDPNRPNDPSFPAGFPTDPHAASPSHDALNRPADGAPLGTPGSHLDGVQSPSADAGDFLNLGRDHTGGAAGDEGESWLFDGDEPEAPPVPEPPVPMQEESAVPASAAPDPQNSAGEGWLLEHDDSAPASAATPAAPVVPVALEASFCEDEPVAQTASRVLVRGTIMATVLAGCVAAYQILIGGGFSSSEDADSNALKLTRSVGQPQVQLQEPVRSLSKPSAPTRTQATRDSGPTEIQHAEPGELSVWNSSPEPHGGGVSETSEEDSGEEGDRQSGAALDTLGRLNKIADGDTVEDQEPAAEIAETPIAATSIEEGELASGDVAVDVTETSNEVVASGLRHRMLWEVLVPYAMSTDATSSVDELEPEPSGAAAAESLAVAADDELLLFDWASEPQASESPAEVETEVDAPALALGSSEEPAEGDAPDATSWDAWMASTDNRNDSEIVGDENELSPALLESEPDLAVVDEPTTDAPLTEDPWDDWMDLPYDSSYPETVAAVDVESDMDVDETVAQEQPVDVQPETAESEVVADLDLEEATQPQEVAAVDEPTTDASGIDTPPGDELELPFDSSDLESVAVVDVENDMDVDETVAQEQPVDAQPEPTESEVVADLDLDDMTPQLEVAAVDESTADASEIDTTPGDELELPFDSSDLESVAVVDVESDMDVDETVAQEQPVDAQPETTESEVVADLDLEDMTPQLEVAAVDESMADASGIDTPRGDELELPFDSSDLESVAVVDVESDMDVDETVGQEQSVDAQPEPTESEVVADLDLEDMTPQLEVAAVDEPTADASEIDTPLDTESELPFDSSNPGAIAIETESFETEPVETPEAETDLETNETLAQADSVEGQPESNESELIADTDLGYDLPFGDSFQNTGTEALEETVAEVTDEVIENEGETPVIDEPALAVGTDADAVADADTERVPSTSDETSDETLTADAELPLVLPFDIIEAPEVEPAPEAEESPVADEEFLADADAEYESAIELDPAAPTSDTGSLPAPVAVFEDDGIDLPFFALGTDEPTLDPTEELALETPDDLAAIDPLPLEPFAPESGEGVAALDPELETPADVGSEVALADPATEASEPLDSVDLAEPAVLADASESGPPAIEVSPEVSPDANTETSADISPEVADLIARSQEERDAEDLANAAPELTYTRERAVTGHAQGLAPERTVPGAPQAEPIVTDDVPMIAVGPDPDGDEVELPFDESQELAPSEMTVGPEPRLAFGSPLDAYTMWRLDETQQTNTLAAIPADLPPFLVTTVTGIEATEPEPGALPESDASAEPLVVVELMPEPETSPVVDPTPEVGPMPGESAIAIADAAPEPEIGPVADPEAAPDVGPEVATEVGPEPDPSAVATGPEVEVAVEPDAETFVPLHDPSRLSTGTPVRRGSILRRAEPRGRWSKRSVPSHAIDGDDRLTTPYVGLVRVVFQDGEVMEGRLTAVGKGLVSLQTELGRMSIDGRRVSKIDRIDRRAAPAGAKKGTGPLVRARVKGGTFIGHELARDGNEITLLTEQGFRITVKSDDIVPVSSNRTKVGIKRRVSDD